MGKSVSTGPYFRPVRAVARAMSRRAVAKRFGVSAAGVALWVQAVKTIDRPTRPHRIKAFSGVILAAIVAQKDTSLVELVELAELLRDRQAYRSGLSLSGTAWTVTT